jgi:hypothetical protein
VCSRTCSAPALPPSLIPLSCPRPLHTQVPGTPPPPPPPPRGGESRSVFQSLLTPSTRWRMSLSGLPRPPSPPPSETRARRASASLSRMLTHLRPTIAHALARPARGRHCSRTSAQPAHSRLPGPRVALTPHPRRSETPA